MKDNLIKSIEKMIFMLICMIALTGVGYVKTAAAISDDHIFKTIDFKKGEKVTIPIRPGKTGVYCIQFTKVCFSGTYSWYNQEHEAIIENSSLYGDDFRWIEDFYMVAGKTYYIEFNPAEDIKATAELSFVSADMEPEITVYNTENDERYFEEEILENTIPGINWDKKNRKLVLDSVDGPYNIRFGGNRNYYGPNYDIKDFDKLIDVTVEIKGENKLSIKGGTSSFWWAIETAGPYSLNIIGDGTLDVLVGSNGSMISGRDVVIDGPTINFEFDGDFERYREYICAYRNLEIKSGTIFAELRPRFMESSYFYRTEYYLYYEVFRADNISFENTNVIAYYEDFPSDYEGAVYAYGIFYAYNDINIKSGMIFMVANEKVINAVDENAKRITDLYAKESICTCYEDKINISDNTLIFKGKPIDINNFDISLEQDEYKYDGKAKTPKVIINGLEEGKDFTVSYEDNVKPGIAKVTVKGIGSFWGSKKLKFIISGRENTKEGNTQSYDGIHGLQLSSIFDDGKLIYKVTKEGTLDGKTAGKVTVIGLKKKSLKKVSVKSLLTVNGVKYKVTAIGKKAFKKGKKLKSIVVAKNVAKIGKKAFAGCKKLKSIKIKSKKIKKFVKGTFKGVKKTCVIKVPKAKKKVYAKKIKKAGFKGIIK
ncbi:leucine-rich repeat protein [uncultured Eubacterium sp.]|uniref:leucine-rich repeat protein n=1 Tax=uncultured Eubacterium sp. TaxID=165185 RepID=UPI000ED10740|nr:leucine-rich repeat protein [uncultured Eubacterium sp.]HAH19065.1 hypothetical protein [Eubacterium sp.]